MHTVVQKKPERRKAKAKRKTVGRSNDFGNVPREQSDIGYIRYHAPNSLRMEALKQKEGQIDKGIRKEVCVHGKVVLLDNSTFCPLCADNQKRMKNGLAPIGRDGKSVNLHHIDQTDEGPVMEILATEHQRNYRALHTNTGQFPSKIDRGKFKDWKIRYWSWRENHYIDYSM